MLIGFNDSQCSALKQIAVKTQTSVKCTTRFLDGKMLMFAKLSLKSFIYSLAELLTFPDENDCSRNIRRVFDRAHLGISYSDRHGQ